MTIRDLWALLQSRWGQRFRGSNFSCIHVVAVRFYAFNPKAPHRNTHKWRHVETCLTSEAPGQETSCVYGQLKASGWKTHCARAVAGRRCCCCRVASCLGMILYSKPLCVYFMCSMAKQRQKKPKLGWFVLDSVWIHHNKTFSFVCPLWTICYPSDCLPNCLLGTRSESSFQFSFVCTFFNFLWDWKFILTLTW